MSLLPVVTSSRGEGNLVKFLFLTFCFHVSGFSAYYLGDVAMDADAQRFGAVVSGSGETLRVSKGNLSSHLNLVCENHDFDRICKMGSLLNGGMPFGVREAGGLLGRQPPCGEVQGGPKGQPHGEVQGGPKGQPHGVSLFGGPQGGQWCAYEKRKEDHLISDCLFRPNRAEVTPSVSQPRPLLKCYNCDEEGHMARDCPHPRRRQGQNF